MNLVICLLSTRRFLTASQIARTVPGYEHNASDPRAHEAFQRMFERDKAELRELGVPLETGTTSVFETEPGYRIARRDYALPEIRLAPDEAAAVGLAARLWRTAGLASAASSALVKLRAAGIDVDPQATLPIEPAVGGEPALDPLLAAVRARRAVRFGYRSSRQDAPTTRALRPWGVVSWRGRWYVVGYDTDREATRCFRLSRISGPVTPVGQEGAFQPPADLDLRAEVAHWVGTIPHHNTATVRVRRGAGAGLRRYAASVSTGDDPGAGWDVLELRYSDAESLASRLAGYGSAVVVTDPPEVREAVVRQLRALAGEAVPAGAASGGVAGSGPVPGPVPGSVEAARR